MQGLLQFKAMIAKGFFAAPIGNARIGVVDVRDIAAAAVVALTGDGHGGQTYTLTGPEALSHAEMAACLSKAIGREIAFHDARADDLRAALKPSGMPEWQIEGLVEDYAQYARGEAEHLQEGVERATGKLPRGFETFAADYASAFK